MPLNRDGRPGHRGSESQNGSLLLTPPPPPPRRRPLPPIEFPLASLVLAASARPPPNSSSSSGLRGAFPWRWTEEPIRWSSGPEASEGGVLASRGGSWWRLDGEGGGVTGYGELIKGGSSEAKRLLAATSCLGTRPLPPSMASSCRRIWGQEAESSQNERSLERVVLACGVSVWC